MMETYLLIFFYYSSDSFWMGVKSILFAGLPQQLRAAETAGHGTAPQFLLFARISHLCSARSG